MRVYPRHCGKVKLPHVGLGDEKTVVMEKRTLWLCLSDAPPIYEVQNVVGVSGGEVWAATRVQASLQSVP
ncbi:hypothetical protein E2C01_102835 [Portunus trituberculatus]|uniref:Uncharacterized protein n=1 Tax=Portunus trituberculatus TaxID=210409 RepID=A0A5B7KQ31_PORTR|nr:hypothetical protein [Portunus trituberculatus]